MSMDTLTLMLFVSYAASASGYIPTVSSKRVGVLSRETTCSINGFFIMIVFMSHLRQYTPTECYGPNDQLYQWVMQNLGQLMVAPFLLFSGYGVMESISSKGDHYIYDMPVKRIFPYLLDVWIALIPYLLMRVCRHVPTTLDEVLCSMVGWKGLGNSNWYIFAILTLYIITYVSFRFARSNYETGIVGVFIACGLYCKLMILERAGTWFYNTIFCYPAGMLLSQAIRILRINNERYKIVRRRVFSQLTLVLMLLLFVSLHHIRSKRSLLFNVCAIVFVILVVLIHRLLPANSKPFIWFGNHLFYIYMYQRLPMILLMRFADNPVLYALSCFSFMLLLGVFMPRVHNEIKSIVLAPLEDNGFVNKTHERM